MEFLRADFIEGYKYQRPDFTDLGEFVYYRTYSRWLEKEKRRETWQETVARAVNYNIGLEYKHQTKRGIPVNLEHYYSKAEELFDTVFNLKGFLSGRTLWVGGTPVADKFPLSNFNCAFTVIDNFNDFSDLFYLLMVGSGVGFRALQEDVEQIEKYRDVELELQEFSARDKRVRKDLTEFRIHKEQAVIVVGDSKEGWVSALGTYFNLITSHLYRNITKISINFDNVRPKGERLETFGGFASGHESLKNMFRKIKNTLDREGSKLSTLGVLDIANIIGENVVVGGVRRTAEIGLCGVEDKKFIEAKNGIYYIDEEGNWHTDEELSHRAMSNNSIQFYEKPSREKLNEIMQSIKICGEPAFFNMEAVEKKVKAHCKEYNLPYYKRKGNNPCGEIFLDSKQTCNLTTNHCMSYVNAKGELDLHGMIEGFRQMAEAGFRMTLVELEIAQWSNMQERDRLTGVSLTGWQDMVNATGMSKGEEAELLRQLHKVVRYTVDKMADAMGVNRSLLSTTVKPEGTLSLLNTTSSGLHYAHSEYFIRRVRIMEQDPLCQMAKALGWRMEQEPNKEGIKVIEFPCKAPKGRTKMEVSAVEQLENYKMFMENYVEHNASITVHVREHEWEDVEQWVWDNWDTVIGISFLALDDTFYPLLPFEACTKEEYEARLEELEPLDMTLLNALENGEEKELIDATCSSGACPVR